MMADTVPSKPELDSGVQGSINDAFSPETSRSPTSAVLHAPPVHFVGPTTGGIPENSEVLFGPQPMLIDCPLCQQKVITTIMHQNTNKTHCLACCICFLGGILCAMIPYLMKAYNKIEHYCPNCNALVGFYQK